MNSEKGKKNKVWLRRLTMILSMIVVFTTTYMLILPAITLDEQLAGDMGGIDLDLQQESGEDTAALVETAVSSEEVAEEAAGEQETAEQVDAEVSEPLPEVSDESELDSEDSEAAADNSIYTPSNQDTDSVKPKAEKAEPVVLEVNNKRSGFSVSAVCDAETNVPEDAKVKVKEIKDDHEDYEDLFKEAVETINKDSKTIQVIKEIRFYDIKLMSGKDEIEPDSTVNVNIDFKKNEMEAEDPENVQVVHFGEKDGEKKTEVIESENKVEDDKLVQTSFDADSFSVYAVVYTVDFRYDVADGKYDHSITGGSGIALSKLLTSLGVIRDDESTMSDEVELFINDIKSIQFSDDSLVRTVKTDKDTTIGALKSELGLDVEYSAELTEEDIKSINSKEIKAGDWALISLKPFDTDESLTITMNNGDIITVDVTDEQRVEQTADLQVDVNNSYIICTEKDGKYYVLKTDGTTDVFNTTANFDKLGEDYQWTFYYVFKEKDQLHNLDKEYFFIRPISDKTKTISLNSQGTDLLATGTNNVGVLPQDDGGFIFEGYSRTHEHDTKLYLNGNSFAGSNDNFSVINIYKQNPLQQYSFTVKTADPEQGKVTGRDENNVNRNNVNEYIARTNNDKKNNDSITANPVTKGDGQGHNKWIFDYWDLDGVKLENVEQTINARTLPINKNGSVLTAHFKQNPQYVVPADEKQGTPFEDMSSWLETLKNKNIPLDQDGCDKTAEVYDYENRIYRVDLTARSNLKTFDGTIDLGFIMDVSKSMEFPSKLDAIDGLNNFNIRNINNGRSGYNNAWYVNSTTLYTNRVYYIISDDTATATVYKIFYSNGKWRYTDASKDETNEIDSNTKFKDGESDKATNYRYQMYEDSADRSGIKRLDDLKSSLRTTISAMKTLLGVLNIADPVTGNSNVNEPEVEIAYNTFCNTLVEEGRSYNFIPSLNINPDTFFKYTTGGGTRTDYALNDALNFNWEGSATKYAVLITDGAPQGKGTGNTTPSATELDQWVTSAANNLKKGKDGKSGTADDITLITVGLSMDNVERGRRLLYDLADEVNGEKAFYSAKSGDELEDILLHILQSIMKEATVTGKVTDKVNEAFYPVDKATGKPLVPGNCIDLNGNLVPDSYAGAKGILQSDGRTIVWENQDFTWDGWQGTVYVKAKEDLLGGNAVLTNDKNSPAQIEAQGYKFNESQVPLPLADNVPANPHYNRFSTQDSPLVNVNELSFLKNNTEWTVYVGTNVDPKEQIRKLYDNIEIEQVIKNGKGRDTDGDGLPDTVRYAVSDTDNNYYPLTENSISDQREPEAAAIEGNERNTFYMKDLIKKLADATQRNSLSWWDYDNHEIKIDEFITAASTSNGITLEYNEYGLDKDHQDNSTINIKLTSELKSVEKGLDDSPHATEVIGSEVEKYTLTVLYTPDYSVTPVGQGGQSQSNFHVGTYGTLYQGHAAGTEKSENIHKINTYAKPLDVLKTNEEGTPLAGAVFELYHKTGDSGAGLSEYDKDLTGSYEKIATVTTGSDGKAIMAAANDGPVSSQKVLLPGQTYYLVEKSAPQGYERDRKARKVSIETEDGKYTDLDHQEISSKIYPFNWDQGVRILVDDQPVSVTISGTSGNTESTDGSYVSSSDAVSFHTTVINMLNKMKIDVEKVWENTDNEPDSITIKLYRTAHIDHDWDEGIVTKTGSCNEDGEITYTCHNCKETRVVAVTAKGHKPGEPVREEIAPATCLNPGRYDMVTYCTVCGVEWAREHYSIDALGHDWGEWEVTTPATYDAPGVETRVCKNDPSHVETREIPKLVKKTHITYRINTFWYHENSWAYSDLYLRQQTLISDEEFTVGSTVNLSWNDSNRYRAVIYQDKTPEVQNWWVVGNYYWFPNMQSISVNRSTSGGNNHYTLNNITVTENMVIDICLGTDGNGNSSTRYSPADFQFTQNRSSRLMSRKLNASAGSANLRAGSEVMTSAQLQAILDSFIPKDQAEGQCDVTYYDVEGTYTFTKNDQNEWKWSKEDLPKYDENGNEYTYYVVETEPSAGYETTYLGQSSGLHNNDKVTITNEKLKLKIKKKVSVPAGVDVNKANGTYTFEIWNADGSSQVTTKADGTTPIGDLKITVTNGVPEPQELTVEGLAAGTYLIKETGSTNDAVILDTASGGYNSDLGGIPVTLGPGENNIQIVTFTNKYEETQANVIKRWDNKGKPIPESVTVTLLRNGAETDISKILNAGNQWTTTVTGLPKYQNNELINYSWKEEAVDHYFLSGETVTGTTVTLTNTYETYDLETSYVGSKTWSDQNNSFGTRPANLTVILQRKIETDAGWTDLEIEPTWTGKDTDTWTYTFDHLPVFDENGNAYQYQAKEVKPEGYIESSSSTPTNYHLGTITYENGKERVTTDNKVVWTLNTTTDLAFVAIAPTANGHCVVWTHRAATPQEKEAIRDLISKGALPPAQGRPCDFYSGTGSSVYTPHGNIGVDFDEETKQVTLDFGATKVWSQFIVGQFNTTEDQKYNPGTTSFTNTLETVDVEGTKTWVINGTEVPQNPKLTLTRSVTTTIGEGSSAVETTSTDTVNIQPIWSGYGMKRAFKYEDLPKYDINGNLYTYTVSEYQFTVNGVTYTVTKGDDGKYTATTDSLDAPQFQVTQAGNDITNAQDKDFEFSKIWRSQFGEDVTWPEGKTITVKLNAFTDDEKKALTDQTFTLDPTNLPEGWTYVQSDDGKITSFKITGLAPLKDGKPLTYYVVESKVDGYKEPSYADSSGNAMTTADRATNGQQIVNTPENAKPLPSTGGSGTTLLYISGAVLLILSGTLLLIRKRRGSNSI